MVEDSDCEFCGGTREIEEFTTYRDESTGYNPIEEATGTFKPCPICSINNENEESHVR